MRNLKFRKEKGLVQSHKELKQRGLRVWFPDSHPGALSPSPKGRSLLSLEEMRLVGRLCLSSVKNTGWSLGNLGSHPSSPKPCGTLGKSLCFTEAWFPHM